MLSAKLNLKDVHSAIEHDTSRATFGESTISKFKSKHLQFSAVSRDGVIEFWIGEDEDPYLGIDRSVPLEQYRDIDDQQGIKIRISNDGRARVELARTDVTGSPIYISNTGSQIIISWKIEEVVASIANPLPNEQSCKQFLSHGPKPIREQIIKGLYMLWPGEACIFDKTGLSFHEATSRDIVQSGVLSNSAVATEHFIFLISQSLERAVKKSERTAIELSGGYDSSCVAIAAAQLRSDLYSYAALQLGAVGIQQNERRQELVSSLGLIDATAPANSTLPFAALNLKECSRTPYDDMFRMSCVNALEKHDGGDIDLVLTGIGGDELTMENTVGREEWEVNSRIASSAIDASTSRSDMFMRRDIWLVQPLTSRRVVDFCRALPQSMRQGRMLSVLSLARAGLSDGFLFPRYGEHFGVMSQHEASMFDFDKAFAESLIADFNLIDLDALLVDARKATVHGFNFELIARLWFALKLETILRRYVS
ncbi:hypothetical protein [Parasphingorhabdus cellanae]|uniref:Asparagine synthetase domain-containing protein n=1 Tax=Parasphingorhabdus cellanae TaxID=2806553 RepID=A0ABX7T701_9SPHN|nr:hypothetical protein [Parasphingorhabdus cellanae]QTD56906.1 hypothetical protein J4G78_04860 [Parasphingorhabdus cellanae]